ncbi:hypothetical protein NKR23_g2011 [Pleurostoma richardsiae]|uniref:Fe2OG dioxygenase domain-containing protein n=1 Tax=Pleurostoma richardsiae TaxID=41990 RepID=A0AA38S392_9PEZI|nr:hypothetical protein NKR23_g2011 [Pleurostoma richardsiae]
MATKQTPLSQISGNVQLLELKREHSPEATGVPSDHVLKKVKGEHSEDTKDILTAQDLCTTSPTDLNNTPECDGDKKPNNLHGDIHDSSAVAGSNPSFGPDDSTEPSNAPKLIEGVDLVWADKRQALCDSLDYFKAHQGGLYRRDNIARGMLISSGIEIRDVLGKQVVITTMGGGRSKDEGGNMRRTKNHMPSTFKAWTNAHEGKHPLMVVLDQQYPNLPCEPPHKYSVLSPFHITDIWAEKRMDGDDEILIHKIRLEKIDLQEDSWWWSDRAEATQPFTLSSATTGKFSTDSQTCPHCNATSKTIFTAGWTCLSHRCTQFFQFNDDTIDVDLLEYVPEFLLELTSYVLSDPKDPQDPEKSTNAIGSITVFTADDHVRKQGDGPDDLFRQMESANVGLHRNAVRCKNTYLEVFTRHFQQNFGAPYKFGVTVASKSFAEAPDVILKALQRLRWAGKIAIAASDRLFSAHLNSEETPLSTTKNGCYRDLNELLSLGYMEGDSIAYHDDGEAQLGPTVVTLSLGSPSFMSIRPKKKSGLDFSCGTTSNNEAKPVLEFLLSHGDMVVMHGRAIHKYYEHAVEPFGKRRFALTSRHIRSDAIPEDEKATATEYGTVPQRADEFAYSGDLSVSSPEQIAQSFKQMQDFAGDEAAQVWRATVPN